jgi:hypothetical protein
MGGSLVPWRGQIARRATSTPAVPAPKAPARRGPDGVTRIASAPQTGPLSRGITGFAVAFIDTQRDIGRGKRARRQAEAAVKAAKLRADYERAGRLSLPAPKPPELTP